MTSTQEERAVEQDNLHTRELFDTYYSDRDWNRYRPLLSEVVRYAPPGKILDLGCGLGFFMECARNFGFSVEGVEGSLHAVEQCQAKGLSVKQQLIGEGLPYSDEEFSTVVMNQVIEHLPASVAKLAIQESYRVLSRRGIIIIKSPCRLDRMQREEETHINLYTPSELYKEVESAGFTVINRSNSKQAFGMGKIGKYGSMILHKATSLDFFLSSANCIAAK